MGNSQSNSLNRNGETHFSFGKKKVKSSYESKIERYKQDLPKLISSEYEHYKNILQSDIKLLEREKYPESYKKRIRTEYQKLFEELAKQEEISNIIVEFNSKDKKRDSVRKLKTFENKVTQLENQSKVVKTKEETDSLREEVMKCIQSLNQNKNKMKQDRELVKRLNELLTYLGRNVGKSSTFFEDNRPAIESRPSTSTKKFTLLKNHGTVQKTKEIPKLSAQNQDLIDLFNATKKLDPLKEIEKQLDELQIRLDNFDGDRKSLEFLHLDQDLLNIVQVFKKIDTNDIIWKMFCVAKARDMQKSLYKKIDEMEAEYEKKVTLRFEKILEELKAMDVELVDPLDNAKHTYFDNVLIDLIREVNAVDSENHPNLLQEKSTTVKKIQEYQMKLDQKMVLIPNKKEIALVSDNKIENVGESNPKIPNKPLEMTKSIKEPDPLMYVEEKLIDLQIQLDSFDGDRKRVEFLYLDQNFLKVLQDINKADSSDNIMKTQYADRAKAMRQCLFKKIEKRDADYEKEVFSRFGKIINELTTIQQLVCYLDDAKRTQVENILKDWIGEVDDVDTDKHPNLLQEKRSLIRKIKEQSKKIRSNEDVASSRQ